MDYTNLINKTIFDFTNDPKIIWEEFGISKNAKDYNDGLSIRTRVMDFLDLADILNDDILKKEVLKQFKNEFDVWGLE